MAGKNVTRTCTQCLAYWRPWHRGRGPSISSPPMLTMRPRASASCSSSSTRTTRSGPPCSIGRQVAEEGGDGERWLVPGFVSVVVGGLVMLGEDGANGNAR